jgi:hypothetical protein
MVGPCDQDHISVAYFDWVKKERRPGFGAVRALRGEPVEQPCGANDAPVGQLFRSGERV